MTDIYCKHCNNIVFSCDNCDTDLKEDMIHITQLRHYCMRCGIEHFKTKRIRNGIRG